MGNYILSHKRHVLTFFVSVVLSVLLVAFYAVGASLIDTDSVGVGTTTVGAGLSVAEGMPTILSSNAYIYGQLKLPYLVSTSTTASSFGGPVGVGTTTPGTARFGVNEGWTSVLSGNAYVYGQLTVPYLVATSTANASTSTLSHINIDSGTFIVDKSNRIAIGTTTFGSINDETMTIQAGSITASTTMYLGGSAAMLILRTTDGQDCAAISVKQATIVAGGAANNGTLSVDVITCPAE